ncbi:DUF4136 domain-containing protein [Sphingomonas naphthae]|uniref:DUF4136 domain-containing protein n=1 Tax=Sphingomonas naphthae TaxID=1813468 RepID=A0ABY7TGH7_9SPHN|nr:DUF4136 domain-containing protein [Sphingomonas naphthae]WCT72332.1 DUF4136 domain-containing protein [Sphingomonas naphthae]
MFARPLLIRATLALPLLALAACATAPDTRVTRFHLNQPIAPAAISIEARDPALANLEYETYAGAVNGELARNGFTPAPRGTAELVAVVDVQRQYSAGPIKPPPFSIGIGGGTFGRNVGVGGGVTLPVGKARATELVQTNLAVQIKRRSDNTVIWEGRAVTQAKGGTEQAAAANAAPKLAAALFGGFPGESGRTISVK